MCNHRRCKRNCCINVSCEAIYTIISVNIERSSSEVRTDSCSVLPVVLGSKDPSAPICQLSESVVTL